MSDSSPDARGRGLGVFTMECVVAVSFLALGAVVMWDSRRIGAGWASDGPQGGYFPFHVGLLIVLSSIVNLVLAVRKRRQTKEKDFATWEQLKLVSEVLIPSLVYVIVIPWLGIYVSTALFIIWFMRRVGKYSATRIAPIAVGIPVLVFLTFEIWFRVPLPKGPVERLLGF
jgi:hypothetical protein